MFFRKNKFFERLKKALMRSHQFFVTQIESLILGRSQADEDFFEELEEILIRADVGVATTQKLITGIQKRLKKLGSDNSAAVLELLKTEMVALLSRDVEPMAPVVGRPRIILVVGVNGVGKTTSIAKLAAAYRGQKQKVLLVAGDTFRAAAIEQLSIWGERVKCPVIKQQQGADPAAVIYDGVEAGLARKFDVVLIDTAGRLHNKKNLIMELEKIVRVIRKLVPEGPDETFLVLDGTTGQNALVQAREFQKVADVTGVIITKLDGTSKGGIIVAVKDVLGIPIRHIGVGEKVDDLREFEPDNFIEALFED